MRIDRLSRYFVWRSKYKVAVVGLAVCGGLQLGWTKDHAGEAQFFIKSSEKTITFKRSDLVFRKDLTHLEIDYDPVYLGKKMTYEAIPVKSLFRGIGVPEGAVLQFHCLDGFSAPISQEKILNDSQEKSIAYLAIEMPDKLWPPLNPPTDLNTAGPFYLVWVNPKLSNIGREEWPYQLVGFDVKKSVGESFPAIVPKSGLAQNHAVMRGFQVFTRNCFTCHTMNLQGESKLGPDLNAPMSPTEYLMPDALKTVIRDPQALRFWPLSKMHGFPKDELADSELDDLLAYLKHMVGRKVKVPTSHTTAK